MSHGGVADVAVIGVNDPRAPGNELPRAYVVMERNAIVSEEELKSMVKLKLAHHKQLRGGVVFVKEIPKSSSGKILRRNLKEQANNVGQPQGKL